MLHGPRSVSHRVLANHNCPLQQKWCDQGWKGGALARDVKNRVRVFGFALQHLDCVDGGQDKQFDFVTLGFALYSLHDGQSTVCTTADDELMALPGDLLFYRKRRVTELFTKFLRRLFLALADFAAINDDIMFVRAAIDPDGTERELSKRIRELLAQLASGAFLRRDRVEGRLALPDFLAATVRTYYLTLS